MDLIQLKVPPERAVAMADSIERDLAQDWQAGNEDELREILNWLRYRIDRWNKHHPATPAA